MKKYAVLNFTMIFAVLLSACTAEMKENLNELSTNSKQKIENNKTEFISEVSKELEKAEIVLLEIENEAKKTSEKLSEDTLRKLEDIEKERSKLERQIDSLKNVSQENWAFVKNTYTESIENFKSDFNSLMDELEIS